MDSGQGDVVGPSIGSQALLLIARYVVHLTLLCIATICAILGLVGLMRVEATALFAVVAVPLGFAVVRYGRTKVKPLERVVNDAIDRQEGQEAKAALRVLSVLLHFLVAARPHSN